MQSLDSLIAQIRQCGGKPPKELTKKINEIARKAVDEMSKQAAIFLNDELDDNKHTVEQVKTVIELFPKSLSHTDEHQCLPIQNAAMSGDSSGARSRSSVTFVPLLAREGCRLGVGGEGKRGGLLSVIPNDDDGDNTIQYLSSSIFSGKNSSAADGYDLKRAQVLEELRDMSLLKKADIEEYGLMTCSLDPRVKRRFEYFTTWDPDVLGARDYSQWMTPIHSGLELRRCIIEESFERVLKAGMKHFPEHLGFLFCEEEGTGTGTTACKKSFDKIGHSTAMHIIRRCIPPSDNHPILHHAIKYAPDLVGDIAQFYPDAVFLRDDNGHTLSQVKFYLTMRGRNTFQKQSLFFVEATDDQISTRDPSTGLYPFMSAAIGNKSDLTAVYYLLSRNPKLAVLNQKVLAKDCGEVKCGRKRQQRSIS